MAGILNLCDIASEGAATDRPHFENDVVVEERAPFGNRSRLGGRLPVLAAQARCLTQCRSPVNCLTAHWLPGVTGSFLLGMRHGICCVGCCWLLMALLFVGGIMNIIWIAALALIVFVEKILPGGERVGRVLGVALIAWAGVTLLV
jgi:hypothetical protein